MQICWNCGTEQLDGAVFCSECGASLVGRTPRQETTASLGHQTTHETLPTDFPDIAEPEPALPSVGESFSLVLLSNGRRLPLEGDKELLIGRVDEKRGIVPDIDLGPHGGYDAGVSRRHALLSLHAGKCLLEDLGSANGTFINNRRVVPNHPTPVSSGDEVKFGTLLARVEFSEQAASDSSPAS